MRDTATLIFVALVAIAAGYAFWFGGTALLADSAIQTASLTLRVVPVLTCGLLIGAFAGVLMPRELLLRWVGEDSGFRGIVLASIGGALMPGGPFTSFPLVHALHRAGAGTGAMVAFLVAWAAVGVNRLFVWEFPFMGVEFGLLRLVSSLPLPLAAGIAANALIRRFPHLGVPPEDKR